ncbi:MAG: hypothetical protein QOJ80_3344 [Mycobacterium sp.]|nr:hypothetical protein [Mycobacterium sp.]
MATTSTRRGGISTLHSGTGPIRFSKRWPSSTQTCSFTTTREIDQIDWHDLLSSKVHQEVDLRIVVPLLVIDELDNAKRGNTRSRARAILKKLWDWFETHPISQSQTRHEISIRTEVRGEVTVELLLDVAASGRSPGRLRPRRRTRRTAQRVLALMWGLAAHGIGASNGGTATPHRAVW